MVYKIADTVFRLSPTYQYTRRLLKNYESEEPAEIAISVTETDILAEKERAEEPVSSGYAESLAVLRKLSDLLLDRDTLLFHGSAIAVDGVVAVFAAPSGTGKSTHARLLRELLSERTVMVNDDKPVIRVADPCIVYGTPWDGKHRLSSNVALPLGAICFLSRDTVNHIERISAEEGLPMLLSQAYRAEAVDRILPLALRLAEAVPLYKLGCNMEPEAAKVSWAVLSQVWEAL
ncbi:MAG: hypothetical protein K5981_01820 [Clostridia bacterium]|nr:hypothetical protein [Clostridia bacterium]